MTNPSKGVWVCSPASRFKMLVALAPDATLLQIQGDIEIR
jgi:hypothetical protein